WQGQRCNRTTARTVRQRDRPAVTEGDLLRDGKAESGTRQRARLIGAEEAIENVWQRVFRDAGTAVGHHEPAARLKLDVDDAACRAELPGVVEHVGHRTVQPPGDTAYGGRNRRELKGHIGPVTPSTLDGAHDQL